MPLWLEVLGDEVGHIGGAKEFLGQHGFSFSGLIKGVYRNSASFELSEDARYSRVVIGVIGL